MPSTWPRILNEGFTDKGASTGLPADFTAGGASGRRPLILQGETLSYRIAPDTLAISVNKVPVSAGQPARQVDKLTRGSKRPAGTGLPRTPESRSNWTVMTCC